MNECLKDLILHGCAVGFMLVSLVYLKDLFFLKKKPTMRMVFWWVYETIGFCGAIVFIILLWWWFANIKV